MRTRTWAVTGAFIRHVEQRSMSHFSSRAAPSSRKRCHPRHERSVPGTLFLPETRSSQGGHRDHLLLIPSWGRLCCLRDVSKLVRAGGEEAAMCGVTVAKQLPFAGTLERQMQYSIDFWTPEAPWCKCPPPFWQTQPNSRAFLTAARVSFKSTPGPFLGTLLLWTVHYRTSDRSKMSSN